MMRTLPCCSLTILAACAAPPAWTAPPPDVPTTWRDRTLFTGPHAWVLAADEADAAAMHTLASELATGLTEAMGTAPKPGLWIALDTDEPLPTTDGDAAAYLKSAQSWFARASGTPNTQVVSTKLEVHGSDRPVELDPALVARVMTAPVPKDAPELALPAALGDAVAFVAILPTDACLGEATAELTDIALEAGDIPAWKVAAASLVVGHPATLMQKEMAKMRRQVLAQVWLHALGATPAETAAACASLGLRHFGARAAEPEAPEPEGDIAATIAKLTYPGPDRRIVTGAHPAPPLAQNYAMQPWRAVVDLGPQPDAAFATFVRAAGKAYVALPCTQLPPDAEFCRRLDEVLRQHAEGTVFVCAVDAELAGAAIALHGHHCRGLDGPATLELARHHRLVNYLGMVREAVLPPTTQRR